ncbi:putative 2-dehydro-3-deoxygluconokinase [Vibrio ichthyoenteri ATCC 700023]|uniref:2-dehydro-3-deoxygluconokinase n=1 Tax=Vibrio ichthyoenteri ATCC 700023 TaxID=870968 RepID=F9S6N4_9VIBR|nr:sugar kinase [Vibrio ichthyoenteri]EGU32584.1 putative 2-dehydro-3-deoxygluconokinase [Vibrio ichthyoenteri ATCC 700023]
MKQIKRVAIIGECMVELKKNNGVLEQGFGGDTLNTGVYLSRLTQQQGVITSYVTGLGRDPFSKEMLASWQQESLNTDMVFISENKLPGIYAIETADDGERSFFYWRNDSAAKYWLRDHEIAKLSEALCQYQMIYLSGISLAILPDDCRQSLIELLAYSREQGVKIAFDNNYRPALWASKEEAQHAYQKVLALTDIAFLTFDDEQALYGDEREQQAIDRTQALGVQEIVIKRGAEACLIVSTSGMESVAPTPVTNIVDTTAAGDSFSAGYLAKRILGGSKQESAMAGHTLAGTVIQHHGAVISSDSMPII